MTNARVISSGLSGLVAGAVVATLLHNYPKSETHLRSYCQLCGAHRHEGRDHTILGGRSSAGFTSNMLSEMLTGIQGHVHQWAQPMVHIHPSFASPSQPELGTPKAFAEMKVKHRLDALDNLTRRPALISAAYTALLEDRARTEAFFAKFLDPARYYPASAINLLAHEGSWDQRWQLVDAFDEAYQCTESATSVSCLLSIHGESTFVLEMAADGRMASAIPNFTTWRP